MESKSEWNIRFTLKNGVSVDGVYFSDNSASDRVLNEIIQLMNKPGEQWLTVKVNPSCVHTVRLSDVSAIKLWV